MTPEAGADPRSLLVRSLHRPSRAPFSRPVWRMRVPFDFFNDKADTKPAAGKTVAGNGFILCSTGRRFPSRGSTLVRGKGTCT